MTTIIRSTCPKCGIIEKSGRSSCCGRGGSWFGHCGGAGNTQFLYTWQEGIQLCKSLAQFKITIGQQRGVAQRKGLSSSNGDPTPIFASANTAITKSVVNISTHTLMIAPVRTSVSTSITAQGCELLLKMAAHISLVLIIIC